MSNPDDIGAGKLSPPGTACSSGECCEYKRSTAKKTRVPLVPVTFAFEATRPCAIEDRPASLATSCPLTSSLHANMLEDLESWQRYSWKIFQANCSSS